MERADRRREDSVWDMVCCSVEGKCKSDKDTGNASEPPMVGLFRNRLTMFRYQLKERRENDRKKRGFCESSTRTIFTEWSVSSTIAGMRPISIQNVGASHLSGAGHSMYKYVLRRLDSRQPKY